MDNEFTDNMLRSPDPWQYARNVLLGRRGGQEEDAAEELLDRGVNFFVLALEAMGANTLYSCEGHHDSARPWRFYIKCIMSERLARWIDSVGYLGVKLCSGPMQPENCYVIERTFDSESRRDYVLGLAAQNWVKAIEAKPIMFLDIDGVLNQNGKTEDAYSLLCPASITNLKRIVKETDARVVITSTWRWCRKEKMHAWFRYHEIPIDDVTPVSHEKASDSLIVRPSTRGAEITMWMQQHYTPRKLVILDDDGGLEPHENHWFKTDGFVGLTNSIADAVIDYLRR